MGQVGGGGGGGGGVLSPHKPLRWALLDVVNLWCHYVANLLQKFDVMDSLFGQCCQLQATPHYILFLSILSQALLNYLK